MKDKNMDPNKAKRISRKERIIDLNMWRNIFCQTIYQILVMVILIYFGGLMFCDKPYNLVTTELRHNKTKLPTEKLRINTLCFNTFMLMNLFNMINCRIIGENDFNIFKNSRHHMGFWAVFLAEMALQFIMVIGGEFDLGSSLFGTAPMSRAMWITSWCLGFSTLFVAAAVKKIPILWFSFINIDLETVNDDSNFVTRMNKRTLDGFGKV